MPSIEELHEYVDDSMTNHAPQSDDVVARFESLRYFAKTYAHAVLDLCPENIWRDNAIQQIEVALMWGTKAIACDQDNLPDIPLPQVSDAITFDPEESDLDLEEVGPFADAKDLEEVATEALAPREQEHSTDLTRRLGDGSITAPIHAVEGDRG